jgi:hypothetical protein
MVPAEAEILRIAQLVVSAMMMFPEPSTATPLGNPSLALVAKPPSPEYPQCNLSYARNLSKWRNAEVLDHLGPLEILL